MPYRPIYGPRPGFSTSLSWGCLGFSAVATLPVTLSALIWVIGSCMG